MSKICQVREAYRKRGWAFMNSENIAQCKNDDYLGKIKEQEGEACNIYGYLEVNKAFASLETFDVFVPGHNERVVRLTIYINAQKEIPPVSKSISHTPELYEDCTSHA
eukprot:1195284-Prorocentrum_minimum.AAC.4